MNINLITKKDWIVKFNFSTKTIPSHSPITLSKYDDRTHEFEVLFVGIGKTQRFYSTTIGDYCDVRLYRGQIEEDKPIQRMSVSTFSLFVRDVTSYINDRWEKTTHHTTANRMTKAESEQLQHLLSHFFSEKEQKREKERNRRL